MTTFYSPFTRSYVATIRVSGELLTFNGETRMEAIAQALRAILNPRQ